MKRVFLVVLDSVGIGQLPDAKIIMMKEAILYMLYQKVSIFICPI